MQDLRKKEDARTMILMFGDHQPGLDANIYDTMLQIGEPAFSERSELSYITPFLLWANYDLESEDNILTSPNYLRTMLLEQAEIDPSGNRRILSSVAPVLFHIFFNDACMSLFIIIIDAYQQNFTCIILNPGSILLFLNLLDCSLSGFLPL